MKLVFKWIEDAETPIQATNFVILEKKKNWWHNNGGQNYQVPCALVQGVPSQDLPVGDEKNRAIEDLDKELLPLGKKLGELVSEII